MITITKDGKYFYEVPETIYTKNARYELCESLGVGGNSAVWEFLDNDGSSYEIKFLLNLNEQSKKRFFQEVKLHSQLTHEHFIHYIDSGEVEASEQRSKREKNKKCIIPFIVMEKAEKNLMEYIKEHKGITYSEYIQQFLGLSDALGELHKMAIHRDLKLENILIVGDRWVIGDFGLCSFLDDDHEDLTRENEKVGPKYWMSPEAINRLYDKTVEIVPASDVFQMAAIFWFVVNNRFPLGIVTDKDWKSQDIEICNVLLLGLQHSAEARIQCGSDFHKGIEEVAQYFRSSKR